ncbi:hypothetical protein GCM10011351_09690 [Paraliobacillus quinghaiensis]|uniref:YppG-like protein n=1 Tax=Paraliobacillus quinghaiensis TaxID=470815 RepID=A0A917TJY6_9BACI|nr:YppG family protein [Paraliobacillus quinghaiensis]GGM26120.1 hypothetical protein GCM10011351_09690 [Paraliobacillus quinghaiensis]
MLFGPPPQRNPYRGPQPRRRQQSAMNFPPQNRRPFRQSENPFQRDFMMPQRPQPYNQQNQTKQSPVEGLSSLIKDENGNIDMNKVGSSVQQVMGIYGQAAPLIKMVRGFF